MRIGIELRHITPGSSGGLVPHLKGLLETAFDLYPEEEFFVYCTIYNRSLISNPPANVRVTSLPTVAYFKDLENDLCEKDIEVLFRSFPVQDNMNYPLSRQLVIITDLQHEQFPQFFSPEILKDRRTAYGWMMSKVAAIGTNTRFTRQTIQEHADNRCQDIFLIPPAINSEYAHADEANLLPEELDFLPRLPYFFCPGNLWPHKNHRRLLQAFQIFLRESGLDMELILTGHPDGWEELKAEFPDLPVRHLGFIRPGVLKRLYRHATALAFFSLYEGFGMPLLEAFDAGTPVICSNTTSLPEVGGDAILSCDPTDVHSISRLMVEIVSDQNLRSTLVARGRERLGHYSWEKSAASLMQAFERAPSAVSTGKKAERTPTPLVTVVTPSYNQGRFLRRTIESVLNQTYPHIAYIVMDGASTDDSVEILNSYGDRFTWISERDQGQADAINKGFERGDGEILAYLNSDDVLAPDAVQKVVDFFTDHPEVDLVYGRANYIDEDDRVTGMYNTDEYSFQRLVIDNCICQPATFWRRRIADLVGPFDTGLHMAIDYDYWLRVATMGGRIAHIHEVLASSRLYAETKTLSLRERAYAEVFQVSKKHAGYVHFNYFLGLWYHRLCENPAGIYRYLGYLPKSQGIFARLHYLIFNRKYLIHRIKFNPGRVKRYVTHVLKSTLGFLRPLARNVRSRLYLVDEKNPVFGLWPDNRLGPVFQVYVKRKNPGQKLYLAGIPVIDSLVKVMVDHHTAEELLLRKDKLSKIVLEAEPGQKVLFKFAKNHRDETGRYITMQLSETNLFAEHDVIY
jgi:glycosyltransferase involved in cell wall biosynthesis